MIPDPFGDADIALDWGPAGAAALANAHPDIAVVVDVLSFTTTVCVAVEAGAQVLPYRWAAEDAEQYARAHDAILARGRRAAATGEVSLSPNAMRANVRAGDRIVLPSPNGAAIAHQLAGSGARVVAACLRNAAAVAAWIGAQRPGRVAVVAAGERWPDGALRPASEDLLGAGAVICALAGGTRSVEAELAAVTYQGTKDPAAAVRRCVSGRELIGSGWVADVEIAVERGVGDVVPVLGPDGFQRTSG